jgi:hypothetical protein
MFAVSFLLARYVGTFEVDRTLLRPLVLFLAIPVAAQVLLAVGFRNAHLAAAVVTIAFGLLFDFSTALIVAATANVSMLVGFLKCRRLIAIDWPKVTAFLLLVSVIAMAQNVPSAVARAREMSPIDPEPGSVRVPPQNLPNIYVVMLDGYPRQDTLATSFNFDNSSFYDGLEAFGFAIATRSHANYNMTLLTLASLMNMAHVGDVVADDPDVQREASSLIRKINGGAAIAAIHRAGYQFVSISSGITQTSIFAADEYLEAGQVTSFEVNVLRAGQVPSLLPDLQRSWLYSQQRDRIRGELDLLVDVARRRDGVPRVVFIHLMSPHSPLVFAADGGPAPEMECIPQTCNLWDEDRGPGSEARLLGQLQYLNGLVLDAVASVIEGADRPPVAVVFSDHGARHDLDDRDEMLRNVFFSLTPEHPGLFPEDASPVNLFPRLLNAYAGAGIPLATEEAYEADMRNIRTQGYLPVEPWPIR